MKTMIPTLLLYGAFLAMEWPLLRKPGKGRYFYGALMLLNLGISLAAAQGLRLPTPSPLFERMIRALPFLSGQVMP